MLSTILFVASMAVSQQTPISDRVPRTPDIRNGYEDYLRAADIISQPEAHALLGWSPSMEPAEVSTGDNPALVRYAAEVNRIRGLRQLQVYRRTVASYGKVLDIVRTGNAKVVYDPRESMTPDTVFPEMAEFRSISKLFKADAYVKFADGNSAAATDSLIQSLTFGHKMTGANLIATLVGIACTSISLREFENHLGQLSQPDCKRIQAAGDALLAEPSPMIRTLDGEIAFTITALSDMLDDPKKFGQYLDASSTADLANLAKGMGPKEKEATKTAFKAMMQELSERLHQRLELPEKDWENADQDVEPVVSGKDPIVAMFAQLMTPVYGQAFGAAAKERTQLRLLALHARVLNYKWENGRLPDKLADAVEANLLHDPMSGEEFRYELRPGGYRLYSKGSKMTGEIDLSYVRPPGGQTGPRDPNEPPLSGT